MESLRHGCVVLGTLLCGCADYGAYGEISYAKRLTEPVSKVAIEVDSGTGGNNNQGDLSAFRTLVTSELAGHVPLALRGDPEAARVRGSIEVLMPASRWLQPLGGLFGGSGHFRSTWTVINASGVEVADCQISGLARSGATYAQMLTLVAERVRMCIRK